MSNINRCLLLDAGHNLTIEERPIPEPQSGEVLVKVAANGICGSDVHFYKDGRLGNCVVTTPYTPGHEASGVVAGVGEGVKTLREGDRVTVEPGFPCGCCAICRSGRYNLCKEMHFLSQPPIHGTFRDYITVPESFAFPIPDTLSLRDAAMTEPLAVAIHSVNRAGMRTGATGLIVGAGPIGLLTLQAFKAAGGGRAICVDLIDKRLDLARKLGAEETFFPGDPVLCDIADAVFETAGSAEATAGLFGMARQGASVVQVGCPGGNFVKLDIATMMDKEINYTGIFRYANAYPAAITWLAAGRINTKELITHTFPFDKAIDAFNLAADHPKETIKVVVEN